MTRQETEARSGEELLERVDSLENKVDRLESKLDQLIRLAVSSQNLDRPIPHKGGIPSFGVFEKF